MKLLIVEDNKTQNDVLANFLRKEGYEVISAYSITEARDALNSEIKLIILDVMLPDGNGLDFLKEIRMKNTVPVIVLTALDDEYTQINCFELKADEYVDKPVSPAVMTKRVNALISRIYPEETLCTLGKYHFDFQKYKVFTSQNEDIPLTTKEIHIIKLLYEAHGNVVNRETILDRVWGFEYIGENRLIDTHIKNIRKKIDPNLIITVKNVGYRLNI